MSESLSNRLWNWHCERFDRLAATKVERDAPDVVIGHDDSCLYTHQAARGIGALAVLNQVTGHTTAACRILMEERRVCPEFNEDLVVQHADSLARRKGREPLEADYILSPSRYVKSTLSALGISQERVIHLPYGVETKRFSPRITAARPFRVLFVGRVWQRKGIKYLLDAFRRLSLKDAELILVGSLGSSDGLAPYRNIFTHVHNVPYAEVHRYFTSASIFVYPSLHEGSALAIYEALASGLPVITTPNAGSVVREGKDGYIVPIRDTAALMDRIQRLYDDENLRQTMALNARARAEEYSWDKYSNDLERILKGMATQPDIGSSVSDNPSPADVMMAALPA